MENNELLLKLQKEISELRKEFQSNAIPKIASDKWIPRAQVMGFLSYGATQMTALEKSAPLIVTKVGKRKFILRASLDALLDNNIQSQGPAK